MRQRRRRPSARGIRSPRNEEPAIAGCAHGLRRRLLASSERRLAANWEEGMGRGGAHSGRAQETRKRLREGAERKFCPRNLRCADRLDNGAQASRLRLLSPPPTHPNTHPTLACPQAFVRPRARRRGRFGAPGINAPYGRMAAWLPSGNPRFRITHTFDSKSTGAWLAPSRQIHAQ